MVRVGVKIKREGKSHNENPVQGGGGRKKRSLKKVLAHPGSRGAAAHAVGVQRGGVRGPAPRCRQLVRADKTRAGEVRPGGRLVGNAGLEFRV